MVKNTKGGSRHKQAKKSSVVYNEKVVLRDESCDEHYAYVTKAYGNAQFGVHLVETNEDGLLALSEKEYRGRVSGRLRKKKFRNFVRANNLVLIAKRQFQTNDEKVDIIHVYKDDAVRKLVKMGHAPQIDNLNDGSDDINQRIVFSTETYTEESDEQSVTPLITQPNTGEEWKVDVDDI